MINSENIHIIKLQTKMVESKKENNDFVIVYTDYGYAKIDKQDLQKVIEEEKKLRNEIQQAIYEDRK